MPIDIAGVRVDNLTKVQVMEQLDRFVKSGRPHHVVTTYSEFIVEAQANPAFKAALNRSALSVADGIGILWAAKFLSLPRRGWLATWWQFKKTLAAILLYPSYIRSVIVEKVSGSVLIWDIAELASRKGYSLALVGGSGKVAEQAASRLRQTYPSLKINLALSDNVAFDQTLVERIRSTDSDILLIAFQPPKQELWLSQNLDRLNVKVAVGLGGTFDYLAGKRQPAPSAMQYFGLEWLWRLITQPWRIKRMWKAIVVFSIIIFNYKRKMA